MTSTSLLRQPLTDRRVLIMGLARSGRAAATLCVREGAHVTCTDLRRDLESVAGCRMVLGEHRRQDFVGADLVVADRLSQCIELGEIHHAVDAGRLQADACVELGAILIGEALGRETDDQITVADLTGLGVQDAAIASATLNGARGKGFGTTIES